MAIRRTRCEVRHFVRRIRSLGCHFALDDFGAGFFSFYSIKELAFDYLELDGSFIANCHAIRTTRYSSARWSRSRACSNSR